MDKELKDVVALIQNKLFHGRSKSSSGILTITIDPFSEDGPDTFVSVEFGGYDFEGMGRNENMGQFPNLTAALKEVHKRIETADAVSF